MRTGRFALPYVAGLTLLVGIPVAGAIALAFTDFSGVQDPEWIGFDNFERLWDQPLFWKSVGNTAAFVAIAVPLRIAAAVALALLLHRRTAGSGAARAVAYLPTVVPDVAYALLWLWLLNPLYGPIAAGASSLGLTAPGWLTEPWAARVSIAVMGAFQIGEAFVVALAARRTVPEPLYEAARVEGARPWFTLRNLTLPVMAPVLGLLALRDVVLALQVNFVPAFLVTEGGPAYATTFLPLYVYEAGFRYFRFGYASAVSVVMFVFTAAILALQYWIYRRWRERRWS
ncbi:MAG TPA: sugar ABC transporter permease [Actinomycetota bacterium]|nr:sugar ABC transporter permease [Actinomycetota bacterium]